MNDNRIEEFDKLGDEIQNLILSAPGPIFGEMAGNALKTLQNIVGILNSSGNYEHGLQRVPDVQLNLEYARDDFHLSVSHIESLKENYRRLRMNSGAGRYQDFD